jgi:hypothetical protein
MQPSAAGTIHPLCCWPLDDLNGLIEVTSNHGGGDVAVEYCVVKAGRHCHNYNQRLQAASREAQLFPLRHGSGLMFNNLDEIVSYVLLLLLFSSAPFRWLDPQRLFLPLSSQQAVTLDLIKLSVVVCLEGGGRRLLIFLPFWPASFLQWQEEEGSYYLVAGQITTFLITCNEGCPCNNKEEDNKKSENGHAQCGPLATN